MSRRVSGGWQAAALFAQEHARLRQTQGRRTQLRLLARRRQALRLHDDLLIRDAQHAIPHASLADGKRTRRQQLLARLSARHAPQEGHVPHPAPPFAAPLLTQEHPSPASDAPLPQQSQARPAPPPSSDGEPRGCATPQAVGERDARGHPGADAWDLEQQTSHADETGEGARGPGGRRRIMLGPKRAVTPLRQPGDLQQFLAAHHRDALTALPMMAHAWARALLQAVDGAGAPRSCVDAALACQEDLLAAWARHGERLDVAQGALLRSFLPALREHPPATDGGAGKPYALLPLLMISGLRPRTATQLRETRTRLRNQRLARVPPAGR